MAKTIKIVKQKGKKDQVIVSGKPAQAEKAEMIRIGDAVGKNQAAPTMPTIGSLFDRPKSDKEAAKRELKERRDEARARARMYRELDKKSPKITNHVGKLG